MRNLTPEIAGLKPTAGAHATTVTLIVAWRKCYDLSQPEMAKLLGVPYKTLEKWEQGSMQPSRPRALEILRKFQVLSI